MVLKLHYGFFLLRCVILKKVVLFSVLNSFSCIKIVNIDISSRFFCWAQCRVFPK